MLCSTSTVWRFYIHVYLFYVIYALQYFDCVTVLFSDVVTFTEICSRIAPMEVVSMLNCMYSLFDQLTEKHNVYKVSQIYRSGAQFFIHANYY